MSNPLGIETLQARVSALESQLVEITQQAETLRREQHPRCGDAIAASVSTLLALSRDILQLDRRICQKQSRAAVINSEGMQLARRITALGTDFAAASDALTAALQDMQAAARRLNDFTLVAAGDMRDAVDDALRSLERAENTVRDQIQGAEQDTAMLEREMDDVDEHMNRASEARRKAVEAQNAAKDVSSDVAKTKLGQIGANRNPPTQLVVTRQQQSTASPHGALGFCLSHSPRLPFLPYFLA